MKTLCENRLFYPLFRLTKALSMNGNFPPLFTLRSVKTGRFYSETGQVNVKTRNAVFEDLIADFIIEERREPDIEEMAWMIRAIDRSASLDDGL